MIRTIARSHMLALAVLLTLPLAACDRGDDEGAEPSDGDPEDADSNDDAEPEPDMGAPAAERFWYSSCGDPACSGYGGPWPDVPACDDIEEGDPCEMGGAICDFMSDCNAVMVCASLDPKQQEGGCPI